MIIFETECPICAIDAVAELDIVVDEYGEDPVVDVFSCKNEHSEKDLRNVHKALIIHRWIDKRTKEVEMERDMVENKL